MAEDQSSSFLALMLLFLMLVIVYLGAAVPC